MRALQHRSIALICVSHCAIALLSGCADADAPSAAGTEPLATKEAALTLGFFPLETQAVIGPAFSGNAAGSGTWPDDTGAANDASVCRECTFTSHLDLGTAANGQVLPLPGPLSAAPGAIDATPLIKAFAQSLWVAGKAADGSSSGHRALMMSTVPAVNRLLSAASYKAKPWGAIQDVFDGMIAFVQQLADIPIVGLLVDDALDDLEAARAGIAPTVRVWARGFRPVQGRFKAAEWLPPKPKKAPNLSRLAVYNTQPFALEEMRFRSARAYCAFRECARAQRTPPGRYEATHGDAASWWGFGLGEYRLTYRVAEPLRFEDSNSANVFAMPIEIGARLAPIFGPLIPRLPEVAHPIVWLSGSAELLSFQDLGPIVTAWLPSFGPFAGLALGPWVYRKLFVNAQHADLFVGLQVSSHLTIPEVPIIPLGIVAVKARGSIDLCYGALLPSTDPACMGVDAPLDGGSAIAQGPDAAYAPPRSEALDSATGGAHASPGLASDAPLALTEGQFLVPAGGPTTFGLPAWIPTLATGNATSWSWPNLIRSIATRLQQNDDRSLSVLDRARASLAIKVSLGLTLGPVSASISGDSDLTLDTRVVTTLREQVSTVNGEALNPLPLSAWSTPAGATLLPQTNFVAIPQASTVVDSNPFTVTAALSVKIPLIFKTITIKWSETIFKLDKAQLVDVATGALGESARLRVGLFSDLGSDFIEEVFPASGVSDLRSVYSHLPDPSHPNNPAPFASFPSGTADGLHDCLYEESAPIAPLPEPEPVGDPAPVTPNAMCAIGFDVLSPLNVITAFPAQIGGPYFAINPSICEDPESLTDAYGQPLNFNNSIGACVLGLVDFLCEGDHAIVHWESPAYWQISRVLTPGSDGTETNPGGDYAALGDLVADCAESIGNEVYALSGDEALATSFAQEATTHLVSLHACTQDGTPIGLP